MGNTKKYKFYLEEYYEKTNNLSKFNKNKPKKLTF